ncbi:glycerol-3-phosphate dehydrogenase [Neorhodopirellula lusitana]|uniref:Glycerol-3-phosphate dehydrogenase n=1 Tax=Neorhodopirellula lusitana TaxID=445327 RepID=A0ABY1Q3X8_9BACT|nr:glycerol-3-phosphate dehydrogenase/oxidase [Neorhodopirellula lusitana]SMP58646.1 glycerol-3-phosphate dehydrogenase [Neorhodopirellula lusitana]
MMNRDEALRRATENGEEFDLVIIGGGATGVGIALDASVRGLSTLLLEQCDFGKGTSSRSTKLIHGGVRYLQQGDVAMVRDSLRERARLQANAPHLVRPLSFIVPCQSLWQRCLTRVGFWVYDLLAGRSQFARAFGTSSAAAQQKVPTLQPNRLRWGGIVYQDGQFDDTRLLIHMAMTAAEHEACLLNYCQVTGLRTDRSAAHIDGVNFIDQETGQSHRVSAKCVINATGPFCDAIRQMDEASAMPIIAPSQGVHLVLPRTFLPGDTAVIVPKTSDGRVLFLIPWHGHVLVGTTDTPIPSATLEPLAQNEEIEFLLATAADYLTQAPTREDCLSVFIGIRPLVRPPASDDGGETKSLSRDHTILVSKQGLITITGGKWTTVRKMAEDCVNQAMDLADLPTNGKSTVNRKIHGATDSPDATVYGTDSRLINDLIADTPELGKPLHADLPIRAAEVIWAVRHEMARTVDDVLARRTRALFLNRRAAEEMGPEVARLMAGELKQDAEWQQQQVTDFLAIARHFEMPDLGIATK